MKDSVWYNKLWQNKMLELPLEGDESAAWQKMQALLDAHLPAGSPVVVSKPKKYVVPVIIAIIAIIAAVLLYFAVSHVPAKHGKTNYRHNNILPYQPKKTDADRNKHASGNNIFNNKKGRNAAANDSVSPVDENGSNSTMADHSTKASSLVLNSAASANTGNNGHGATTAKSISAKTKNGAALKQYHTGINSAGNSGKRGRNNGHRFTGGNNQAGYGKAGGFGLGGRGLGSLNSQRNSRAQNQDNVIGANHGSHSSSQTGIKSAADSVNALLTGSGVTHSPGDIQSGNHTGPGKSLDSAAQVSKTENAAIITNNTNNKTAAASTIKNKAASSKKTGGNSKFELGLKIGVNSNGSFTASGQNSNFYGKAPVDAFLGITAAYYFSPKVGLGLGLNVLSPKSISGSYSKDSLAYTTTGDTGKIFKHNTGKVTIHGSRKVYSVDIPIFVSYKATSNISLMAGPVIGIPVKQGSNKNSLSLLTNSTDTTALKEINPYVNSTTINNKVNFSISGGVRLNFNRLFIDGTYMQNITPYTISSGLGSGKIYYHTVQFGIGFQLFKPKSK